MTRFPAVFTLIIRISVNCDKAPNLILVDPDCREGARITHGLQTLTIRYLWTLDRTGQQSRNGLATENELLDIIGKEALPCVMPADWLLATMQIDMEGSGLSIHESKHNPQDTWKLELKLAA